MTTPIPTYHSIGTNVPAGFRPWVVDPQRFRAQLEGLAASGRTTLTVSELVRRRQTGLPPGNAAVLTFDDGFADFLQQALPVLVDLTMTATLYVATGFLGGTFRGLPTLSWRDLHEVRDAGIEIGAHSVRHLPLDRLPADRVMAEVRESKHQLEDRLGIAVNSFAYPFGYHTPEVREAVIKAGYRSACALGYSTSHDGDDLFALRRFIVRPQTCSVEGPPMDAVLYRIRAAGWAGLRRSPIASIISRGNHHDA